MRSSFSGVIFLAVVLSSIISLADRPNIIVILADDIGVGDISHYRRMHSDNIILETPNIDKLAMEGNDIYPGTFAGRALCAFAICDNDWETVVIEALSPGEFGDLIRKHQSKDNDLTLGRLMQEGRLSDSIFWGSGTLAEIIIA